MRQVSNIILNRHDIQKIAIEYIKSKGFVPINQWVNIEYDPKELSDDRLKVIVEIEAEPVINLPKTQTQIGVPLREYLAK